MYDRVGPVRRPPRKLALPAAADRERAAGLSGVLQLQRRIGNAAVSRLVAAGELAEFPHADRIGQLLGVRIPGRALLDPRECVRVGGPAHTEGTTTRFASSDPPVEVAAHEATHQLQHAGRTNDLGLGAEHHAAAVARRVRAGVSAAGLIGRTGKPVPSGRRPYTEVPTTAQAGDHFDAGVFLRVSDDGRMAAEQSGHYGTHKLWATSYLIAAGNAALTSRGSVIRLKAGSSKIEGKAPDGGSADTRTLSEVLPDNVDTKTSGDTMSLWADCGRSARDVMGVGGGTGKNYDKVTATYAGSGKKVETSASSPKAMADEVVKETLGGGASASDGWKAYYAMSSTERDEYDKETGINRYAAPKMGEGFTIASGGARFPKTMTWNFHWAGVVLRSGGDAVTLENYAVGIPEKKNTDWNYQMYGPPTKAGQTFHEQHLASRQHGRTPTTLVVHGR
jgi:hypothetical protein